MDKLDELMDGIDMALNWDCDVMGLPEGQGCTFRLQITIDVDAWYRQVTGLEPGDAAEGHAFSEARLSALTEPGVRCEYLSDLMVQGSSCRLPAAPFGASATVELQVQVASTAQAGLHEMCRILTMRLEGTPLPSGKPAGAIEQPFGLPILSASEFMQFQDEDASFEMPPRAGGLPS